MVSHLLSDQCDFSLWSRLSGRFTWRRRPDAIQSWIRVLHLQCRLNDRPWASAQNADGKVFIREAHMSGWIERAQISVCHIFCPKEVWKERRRERRSTFTCWQEKYCLFCVEICISFASSSRETSFIVLFIHVPSASPIAVDRAASDNFGQTIEIVLDLSCCPLVSSLCTIQWITVIIHSSAEGWPLRLGPLVQTADFSAGDHTVVSSLFEMVEYSSLSSALAFRCNAPVLWRI